MDYTVLRATEEWQRAASYFVRINAMNRKYHIPLRDEFDCHDNDSSKYVILLDGTYPISTARFYEVDRTTALIGRVVVLDEYRNKGLGKLTMQETEKWIKELGYKKIIIDSRLEAIDFYKKCDYKLVESSCKCKCQSKTKTFECTRMEKYI
ncbi:MAG: GNAT family N-acetyltransferase [Acholeplasmatales bacterium]|nr:GNAT family N-acetyltransferase [Acholeplasmatales bacterium]